MAKTTKRTLKDIKATVKAALAQYVKEDLEHEIGNPLTAPVETFIATTKQVKAYFPQRDLRCRYSWEWIEGDLKNVESEFIKGRFQLQMDRWLASDADEVPSPEVLAEIEAEVAEFDAENGVNMNGADVDALLSGDITNPTDAQLEQLVTAGLYNNTVQAWADIVQSTGVESDPELMLVDTELELATAELELAESELAYAQAQLEAVTPMPTVGAPEKPQLPANVLTHDQLQERQQQLTGKFDQEMKAAYDRAIAMVDWFGEVSNVEVDWMLWYTYSRENWPEPVRHTVRQCLPLIIPFMTEDEAVSLINNHLLGYMTGTSDMDDHDGWYLLPAMMKQAAELLRGINHKAMMREDRPKARAAWAGQKYLAKIESEAAVA